MRKYGESKTTRIMVASVRHVTSSSGRWIFVRLSLRIKQKAIIFPAGT